MLLYSVRINNLVPVYSGGSAQVQDLGNNINEFNKLFNTPSDYLNQREFISDEIATGEIFRGIEKKIEKKVDDFIQMEITNLRKIYLKGKRDPKIPRRPPKVVAPVEKLGKGEKKVSKIPHEELLSDVIYLIFRLLSTNYA